MINLVFSFWVFYFVHCEWLCPEDQYISNFDFSNGLDSWTSNPGDGGYIEISDSVLSISGAFQSYVFQEMAVSSRRFVLEYRFRVDSTVGSVDGFVIGAYVNSSTNSSVATYEINGFIPELVGKYEDGEWVEKAEYFEVADAAERISISLGLFKGIGTAAFSEVRLCAWSSIQARNFSLMSGRVEMSVSINGRVQAISHYRERNHFHAFPMARNDDFSESVFFYPFLITVSNGAIVDDLWCVKFANPNANPLDKAMVMRILHDSNSFRFEVIRSEGNHPVFLQLRPENRKENDTWVGTDDHLLLHVTTLSSHVFCENSQVYSCRSYDGENGNFGLVYGRKSSLMGNVESFIKLNSINGTMTVPMLRYSDGAWIRTRVTDDVYILPHMAVCDNSSFHTLMELATVFSTVVLDWEMIEYSMANNITFEDYDNIAVNAEDFFCTSRIDLHPNFNATALYKESLGVLGASFDVYDNVTFSTFSIIVQEEIMFFQIDQEVFLCQSDSMFCERGVYDTPFQSHSLGSKVWKILGKKYGVHYNFDYSEDDIKSKIQIFANISNNLQVKVITFEQNRANLPDYFSFEHCILPYLEALDFLQYARFLGVEKDHPFYWHYSPREYTHGEYFPQTKDVLFSRQPLVETTQSVFHDSVYDFGKWKLFLGDGQRNDLGVTSIREIHAVMSRAFCLQRSVGVEFELPSFVGREYFAEVSSVFSNYDKVTARSKKKKIHEAFKEMCLSPEKEFELLPSGNFREFHVDSFYLADGLSTKNISFVNPFEKQNLKVKLKILPGIDKDRSVMINPPKMIFLHGENCEGETYSDGNTTTVILSSNSSLYNMTNSTKVGPMRGECVFKLVDVDFELSTLSHLWNETNVMLYPRISFGDYFDRCYVGMTLFDSNSNTREFGTLVGEDNLEDLPLIPSRFVNSPLSNCNTCEFGNWFDYHNIVDINMRIVCDEFNTTTQEDLLVEFRSLEFWGSENENIPTTINISMTIQQRNVEIGLNGTLSKGDFVDLWDSDLVFYSPNMDILSEKKVERAQIANIFSGENLVMIQSDQLLPPVIVSFVTTGTTISPFYPDKKKWSPVALIVVLIILCCWLEALILLAIAIVIIVTPFVIVAWIISWCFRRCFGFPYHLLAGPGIHRTKNSKGPLGELFVTVDVEMNQSRGGGGMDDFDIGERWLFSMTCKTLALTHSWTKMFSRINFDEGVISFFNDADKKMLLRSILAKDGEIFDAVPTLNTPCSIKLVLKTRRNSDHFMYFRFDSIRSCDEFKVELEEIGCTFQGRDEIAPCLAYQIFGPCIDLSGLFNDIGVFSRNKGRHVDLLENLERKDVSDWTKKQVQVWVGQTNISEEAKEKTRQVFQENDIDGIVLIELDEQTLININTPREAIGSLYEDIFRLKQDRIFSSKRMVVKKKMEKLPGFSSGLDGSQKLIKILSDVSLTKHKFLNTSDLQALDVFDDKRITSEPLLQFREAKLKIKIVVTEIVDSKRGQSVRKLLSPVINAMTPKLLKEFGFFHTSIIVGPWWLAWDENELVVPKRMVDGRAIISADVDTLNVPKTGLSLVSDNVAEVVVKWNTSYMYCNTASERIVREGQMNQGNCQDFVDDILGTLGVSIDFGGALGVFVKKMRTRGQSNLEFAPCKEFREFFGVKEKSWAFVTHEELDSFCEKVREQCLDVYHIFSSEWSLLKSFDRAFWLRHMKFPDDTRYQPLPPKYRTLKAFDTGCPFDDPRNTKSYT